MNQQLITSAPKSDQPTDQEGQTGEEVRKVNSLAEYLAWIKECCPDGPAHEYTIFYRGHSDFRYKLEPTAYRFDAQGKSFRPVEHHLYYEMLRRSPSDFSQDQNIFDRLVRMQHYGLPTRLLDLTLSPLIALYFACCEISDGDGEVLSFSRGVNNFCYSSRVPESAFVGIENPCDIFGIAVDIVSELIWYLDKEKNRLINQKIKHDDLIDIFENLINLLANFKSQADDILFIASAIRKFNDDMKSFLDEKINECNSVRYNISVEEELKAVVLDKLLAILTFKNEFHSFCKKLIEDRSDFLGVKYDSKEVSSLEEFILQFTHYVFVLPLISNERIRRQQGAFLMFPSEKSKHWPVDKFLPNIKRVLIGANAKTEIIKDLFALDVSESYIFPELDKLAKDVKLRHPAR